MSSARSRLTEISSVLSSFLMVAAVLLVSTRHASLVTKPEVGFRQEPEVVEDPSYHETMSDDSPQPRSVFQVDESYDLEEYDGEYQDWVDWKIPPSRSASHRSPTMEGDGEVLDEATPRLPHAIIIGVKKGGTRALLEFLRVHPKVRAPGPEVHFFDRHYDKGLEWYRSLMPLSASDQTTIEKTPSYFITRSAPARVYNMSRSARLIIVVRDPVTRAISDYTQVATKRRGDLRSFAQMAFLENGTGPVATSWGAIKIGLYAKHLERWMEFFPRHQLHFVSGERLIEDPATEMAMLQDFLGIERFVTGEHFYFNATKGFPCLRKPDRTGYPHCLGKTKGRAHPEVGEMVLKRLRNFYRPFNEKFYQMTGIDFGWL